MPVPTISDPPQTGAKPPGQPSQKTMTKAERRELQEKQRAAKAALKAQPLQPQGKTQAKQHQQAAGGTPPAHPKAKAPPTPLKKTFGMEVTGAKQSALKDPASSAIEDASAKQASHGLRIFSHFGQPKAVGHTVKGDIHPAIIRLGLLFSEFKICGANARCIAMLLAFKQVRLFFFCIFEPILKLLLLGDPGLYHTLAQCHLPPPYDPPFSPNHPPCLGTTYVSHNGQCYS